MGRRKPARISSGRRRSRRRATARRCSGGTGFSSPARTRTGRKCCASSAAPASCSGGLPVTAPRGNVTADDIKVLPETGYAAPTPATDGERVYATYASSDVAAVDFNGKVVWARNLGKPESPYGRASSLLVYKDKVIVQFDRGMEPADGLSALLALDAKTGKTVWSTPRPVRSCWCTPILVPVGEHVEMVANGSPWIMAYDPETGRELWRCAGMASDVACSPTFAGGLVFVTNENAKVLAIRPGGAGDVTRTNVVWSAEDGMSDAASPVADDEVLPPGDQQRPGYVLSSQDRQAALGALLGLRVLGFADLRRQPASICRATTAKFTFSNSRISPASRRRATWASRCSRRRPSGTAAFTSAARRACSASARTQRSHDESRFGSCERRSDESEINAKRADGAAHGDTSWFVHDRFGLFIHWGLYALAARHEWVQAQRADSATRSTRSTSSASTPTSTIRSSGRRRPRRPGMKYFVITTKHHEGFCLWDTKLTDYKAPNTPAGRDLLRPMVEAFRAGELRVGFYHSLIDWHHPQYVLDPHIGPYRAPPGPREDEPGPRPAEVRRVPARAGARAAHAVRQDRRPVVRLQLPQARRQRQRPRGLAEREARTSWSASSSPGHPRTTAWTCRRPGTSRPPSSSSRANG